jgi:predicted transcriptional regulator
MQTSLSVKSKSQITSVKLGDRKQVLEELAKHQKRSVHSLLVEAVDGYIAQTTARIEYEAQAIRSYENFKATGLHVTTEELEDWANSLNTNTPKPLPECHS